MLGIKRIFHLFFCSKLWRRFYTVLSKVSMFLVTFSGVTTADILTAYVQSIQALRVLDPSCVILEIVTEPVKQYLRWRLTFILVFNLSVLRVFWSALLIISWYSKAVAHFVVLFLQYFSTYHPFITGYVYMHVIISILRDKNNG